MPVRRGSRRTIGDWLIVFNVSRDELMPFYEHHLKPFVCKHLRDSDWQTHCSPDIIESSRAFCDFEHMIFARFSFVRRVAASEDEDVLVRAVWDRVRQTIKNKTTSRDGVASTLPPARPSPNRPTLTTTILNRTSRGSSAVCMISINPRPADDSHTLGRVRVATNVENIPRSEHLSRDLQKKQDDEHHRVEEFLATCSKRPSMSVSSPSHARNIDDEQIRREEDDDEENVLEEDTQMVITISDNEDSIVFKRETAENKRQLPPSAVIPEDSCPHIRISRRLGGDHPTLCFQTHLSVLASNSQEIITSLQYLKLVLLANVHMGFDKRREVLAVEHGPRDKRIHMFIKDDESLKSTVEVILPGLKAEKVLEVLVLNRPSFMGHVS